VAFFEVYESFVSFEHVIFICTYRSMNDTLIRSKPQSEGISWKGKIVREKERRLIAVEGASNINYCDMQCSIVLCRPIG
jgi:predicted metal-binding protein